METKLSAAGGAMAHLVASKGLLWGTAILFGAILVQTAHDVEHLTQLYQHAALGMPAKDSHGLVFFLDLEWNHFVFNSMYFAALVAALVLIQRDAVGLASLRGRWMGRVGLSYLWTGVVVQGFHTMEHAYRIYQHLVTRPGCEPCPGTLAKGGDLLGMSGFDGVYLHFTFNVVVTLLPALILVPLRADIRPACCAFMDWILKRPHKHHEG